eukprot:360322-Chlamydomonas_euryale.AAC.10
MNVQTGNQQSQQGRIRMSEGWRQTKPRPVASGTKMTDGQNSRPSAWLHLSRPNCEGATPARASERHSAGEQHPILEHEPAVEQPGVRREARNLSQGGPQPGVGREARNLSQGGPQPGVGREARNLSQGGPQPGTMSRLRPHLVKPIGTVVDVDGPVHSIGIPVDGGLLINKKGVPLFI